MFKWQKVKHILCSDWRWGWEWRWETESVCHVWCVCVEKSRVKKWQRNIVGTKAEMVLLLHIFPCVRTNSNIWRLEKQRLNNAALAAALYIFFSFMLYFVFLSHICLLECSHSHLVTRTQTHQTTTLHVYNTCVYVCTVRMFDIKLVAWHCTALAQFIRIHFLSLLLQHAIAADGCLGDEWLHVCCIHIGNNICQQRRNTLTHSFFAHGANVVCSTFSCNFPWLWRFH